jgi:hypothetical protein
MEKLSFLYNYESKPKSTFQKHESNGIKTPQKCLICNHVCFNHWNLRHHVLTIHSTKREREKEPYYCNVCDSVFFCKYYIDLHMKSAKHMEIINSR